MAMQRLLALTFLAATCAVQAQTVPQKHSFEVASVKPSAANNDNVSVNTTPHRMQFDNVPLQQILLMSFGIRSASQLEGLPDWATSARYNIDAKTDEETSAAMAKVPREERQKWQQEMMQSMLEDRFHIKFHWGKKDLPVYALTVAKSGSKLKEAVMPPLPPDADPKSKPKDPGTSFSVSDGTMDVKNASMEAFVDHLSRMGEMDGRVVLNHTGLTGRYDWTLEWSPERPQAGFHGTDGGGAASAADTSKPTLFTALQEQLGLKMEQDKAPVDLLIIDHLEQPTEN